MCLKFKRWFKKVSRMLELLRVFTNSFKSISRKFNGCFKEVSIVFQGSFREISRVFQVSFKGVASNIVGCFK